MSGYYLPFCLEFVTVNIIPYTLFFMLCATFCEFRKFHFISNCLNSDFYTYHSKVLRCPVNYLWFTVSSFSSWYFTFNYNFEFHRYAFFHTFGKGNVFTTLEVQKRRNIQQNKIFNKSKYSLSICLTRQCNYSLQNFYRIVCNIFIKLHYWKAPRTYNSLCYTYSIQNKLN